MIPMPELYRLTYPWLTDALWEQVYELSAATGIRYDDILCAVAHVLPYRHHALSDHSGGAPALGPDVPRR